MKSFRELLEEPTMTTGDAGIPNDTKDMMPKKKRKKNIVTRGYIEIMGKRKKQAK
jgi:hypothetical protein